MYSQQLVFVIVVMLTVCYRGQVSCPQLYFGKELYMFRTGLLSIIRSLNTVLTALGICHSSYVDCLLPRSP
jgi:hypothetical protein